MVDGQCLRTGRGKPVFVVFFCICSLQKVTLLSAQSATPANHLLAQPTRTPLDSLPIQYFVSELLRQRLVIIY